MSKRTRNQPATGKAKKRRPQTPPPPPPPSGPNRNLIIIGALVAAIGLVGMGIAINWWRSQSAPTATGTTGPTAVTIPKVTPQSGQPLVYGVPSAPVTVDVYEDFMCSHCVEFEHTYGPVLDQMREEGKIKVAYHPLAFVAPTSLPAANGFACAAESGFGPWYFNGLFANAGKTTWNSANLIALAKQAPGYNNSFDACVNENRHNTWIQSIGAKARTAGVTGTPTLKVNGKPLNIGQLTGPDSFRQQVLAG